MKGIKSNPDTEIDPECHHPRTTTDDIDRICIGRCHPMSPDTEQLSSCVCLCTRCSPPVGCRLGLTSRVVYPFDRMFRMSEH